MDKKFTDLLESEQDDGVDEFKAAADEGKVFRAGSIDFPSLAIEKLHLELTRKKGDADEVKSLDVVYNPETGKYGVSVDGGESYEDTEETDIVQMLNDLMEGKPKDEPVAEAPVEAPAAEPAPEPQP